MDDCVGRKHLNGELTLPVAFLVCNSLPPQGERPALLTHDDVVTLFHEFGHGLHHMLTRIGYPSVAGINGVAWDAVELPSQFMENYAWLPEVLARLGAHVKSGEPLPEAKQRQLIATRSFHAGLHTLRQVEFALFDMRMHAEYDPQRGAHVYPLLAEVRAAVAVTRVPDWNRYPHSFTHIFAGGYAAGYYSYKWAEVLAADAFAAFKGPGAFDRATAQRFLDSILSRGGSRGGGQPPAGPDSGQPTVPPSGAQGTEPGSGTGQNGSGGAVEPSASPASPTPEATRPVPACPVDWVFSFETLSATEWNYHADTGFAPNFYVDIAAQLEHKLAAMSRYSSELKTFPHPRSLAAIEHSARLRGAHCGYLAAEAFVMVRGSWGHGTFERGNRS